MSSNGRWYEDPRFAWRQGQEKFLDELERYEERLMARAVLENQIAAADFSPPPQYGLTMAEDLRHPDEPLTYRFDGLSHVGGNTLLVARAKVGKTILLANAVRAMLSGEPFLDTFHVNPPEGRVAYWNYELTRPQFHAMVRELGLDGESLVERWSALYLRGHRFPFWSPAVEEWAVRWLAEREVEVLVIDPLQRAKAGLGKITDNDDMDQFFEAVDVIKERAGVQDVFLAVHASDKRDTDAPDADDPLGASRIHGWYDARWTYSRDEAGSRWLAVDGREVALPEQRVDFDADTKRLGMAPPSGSRLHAGGKKAAAQQRRFRALVERCIEKPGSKAGDLHAVLDGKTNFKTQVISAAEAHGLIENHSANAQRHDWHATDAGRAFVEEVADDA